MQPVRRNHVVVVFLACLMPALDAVHGQSADDQLAGELREALGFGARTLGALGMSSTPYAQIAADAASFVEGNRQTIEPLVNAVTEHKRAIVRATETQGDVAAAEQAYLTTVGVLADACTTVIETMEGRLSEPQQEKRARTTDNRLLDPTLALLELTSQQRADLLAAQHARDQVLRHHKSRKDLVAVQAALATFTQAVAGVLTENQEAELATLEGNLRAQWTTLADHDETVLAQ